MANIRSAVKRARQAETHALRNKAVKTRVRSAARGVVASINAGEADAAAQALRSAAAVIDRAARKGVIHPNAAARKKSRLAHRLNALRQQQAGRS